MTKNANGKRQRGVKRRRRRAFISPHRPGPTARRPTMYAREQNYGDFKARAGRLSVYALRCGVLNVCAAVFVEHYTRTVI